MNEFSKKLVNRSWLIITGAVFFGVGGWQLYGEPLQVDENRQLKPFMQRKLDHSKSVLEGLAKEDFAMIIKNSQALSLLSQESNWNVLNTEEYLQQSRDFRRAVNVITESARNKNIDRATLGYIDLTVRCVGCHKYLRDQGTINNVSDPKSVDKRNNSPNN